MTKQRQQEFEAAMARANKGRLKAGETRQQKKERVKQNLYAKWAKEDAEEEEEEEEEDVVE